MTKESQRTINGTVLSVPFRDKDQVKQLGARWDPEMKRWFVPQGVDTEPFRPWFEATGESERPDSR